MRQAVVDAVETDTMLINKHNGTQVRVLRTEATAPFELATEGDPMALLGSIRDLYDRGDMNASLAQLEQVAGRIGAVQPVAEILRQTVEEFDSTLRAMASRYLADAPVG
jgi:enoyl-[acyl-carrier protein] reductase II